MPSESTMRYDPSVVSALGKKRILFVDDDPSILAGLSTMLRGQRSRWEMVFALGGEAGLVALRTSAFDVLVSDLTMPGFDGIALMAAAKHHSPRTVRIMLTGSAVDETTIDVYAILAKPCSGGHLRDVLDRALSELAER